MRGTFSRHLGAALLSTLLAMVATIALSSSWSSEARAAGDQNVRDSIVYLEGGLSIGDRWVPYGSATACFVGVEGEDPSYLVTDDHLLDTFKYYGAGVSKTAKVGDDHHNLMGHAVIRAHLEGKPYVEAYLEDYNEQSGLALLKCDRPCEGAVPLEVRVLSETNDVDAADSSVRVVGYPGFLDEAPDIQGKSAGRLDPYVQVAHISKMNTISGSGTRVIWHDAQVAEGNTGGPILDDDGALIAINTWGDEHQNYGINAVEVKALLDLNDVEYESADSMASSDDATPATNGATSTTTTVVDDVTETESDTTTVDGTGAVHEDEEKPEDGEKPKDEKQSLVTVTSNVPLPAVVGLLAAIVLVVVGIVGYPRLRNKR